MTERRAPLKARLAIGAALTIVVSSTIGGVSAKGGKWSVKAPIPNPRPGLAVGVVNGILYAVGGDRGRGDVADRYLTLVEAYNPVTNSWTTKAPMPTGRWGVAVGVLKGTLYAVGGVGRPLPGSMKSVVLSTVEAYDPITNSWATKAPMPTPRSALAVGVVNGILYALGGSRSPYGMIGVDFLNTVEAYDPSKNAWTTTASIPVMRDSFAAGVITKTLYLLGTAGVCSERASVMEAYDPTRNGWKPKAAIPNHSVVSSVGS
jgi:N-acetylneuraminic acid mutarotase